MVTCDIDLRCGGVFATVMQSPEGHTLPRSEGTFLAMEAPRRLVWTNFLDPDFRPNATAPGDFCFVCELRFDALPDGGTRYQATLRHVDEAGKISRRLCSLHCVDFVLHVAHNDHGCHAIEPCHAAHI